MTTDAWRLEHWRIATPESGEGGSFQLMWRGRISRDRKQGLVCQEDLRWIEVPAAPGPLPVRTLPELPPQLQTALAPPPAPENPDSWHVTVKTKSIWTGSWRNSKNEAWGTGPAAG